MKPNRSYQSNHSDQSSHNDQLNRSYRSIIVGLSAMLAILLIGFGTIVAVSQPNATTTALAESSASVTLPLFDTPSAVDASQALAPAIDTADDSEANAPSIATEALSQVTFPADLEAITAASQSDPAADQSESTPAERIYTSARYLATFLALGCYEGLPGADELYNQLLAETDISITDYETLVDEIEAVTAALNSAPDLWHRYADETISRALLPA